MSGAAERLPVLVAGAGPVGLTLAAGLAKRGIAVMVLEKRSGLSAASRASTIHPPTLEALDGLGVLGLLWAQGIVVGSLAWVRLHEPLRAEIHMSVLAQDTPFPHRFHLEQAKITPALLAVAQAAGALVCFDAEVSGLEQSADGVTLCLVDGTRIAGSHAIACDGAAGALRDLAGITVRRRPYGHRVLRLMTEADVAGAVPGGAAPVTYLADGTGGCSLLRMPPLRPGGPDIWRIVTRIPPEMADTVAMDEAHVRPLLRRFLPAIVEATLVSRDVYGVAMAMAGRYRAGRVLVAGDAAHLTNTRGGMNMNQGIHDAATLAAAWGSEAALESWAKARHRAAENALLPRSDARATAGDETARMAVVCSDPIAARQWALEASMIDIARLGGPA